MKTTHQLAREARHDELAEITAHVEAMIERRTAPGRWASFAEMAAYAAGRCETLREVRDWLRARGA